MKLWKGKGAEPVPADDYGIKGEGYAAGNVRIEKLPQGKGRRVEIILIACDTGETIFKAAYHTHLKSDFAAFEDAKIRINDYLVGEELVLQDELTTNAAMPSVVTHQRGGRW